MSDSNRELLRAALLDQARIAAEQAVDLSIPALSAWKNNNELDVDEIKRIREMLTTMGMVTFLRGYNFALSNNLSLPPGGLT